jgi:polyferredoxin
MTLQQGRRRRAAARALVASALLGAFYLLPWLQPGGKPALLLDLTARQFHLFGTQLVPEDAQPLLWLVTACIAALGLLTVLCGRLWCAYICPQTVLTRVFRGLDRLTTFDGIARPLGPLLRHGLWAVIALWTGITFVGYFSPIGELVQALHPFALNGWECFWIAFYALATWANVAHLHEQVCTHLCPYSRVQHLITDANTPIIQYNAPRGEPRGPRSVGEASVLHRSRGLLDPVTASDYVFRAAHPAIAGAMPKFAPIHLGDCTDCSACLQACPIGLDIRNGHTSNCIECSACIDACDDTMARNQFPEGLIHRAHLADTESTTVRRLRVKPLLFAAMMALSLVLMYLSAGGPL